MNNQAPGLQKELFSPRGSLIRAFLEAPSCAPSPQGLPCLWRKTPWHSSQGGTATTRFPFLRTGGTPPYGWGNAWREGGREEPGCSSLSVCTPPAQRRPLAGRPAGASAELSPCTAAGSAG